jgi:Ala-tRNA(Pro) deacylase
LRLVVYTAHVERFAEIAFNSGRLYRSIVLDSADYVRVARPLLQSLSGDGSD